MGGREHRNMVMTEGKSQRERKVGREGGKAEESGKRSCEGIKVKGRKGRRQRRGGEKCDRKE